MPNTLLGDDRALGRDSMFTRSVLLARRDPGAMGGRGCPVSGSGLGGEFAGFIGDLSFMVVRRCR